MNNFFKAVTTFHPEFQIFNEEKPVRTVVVKIKRPAEQQIKKPTIKRTIRRKK